MSVADPIRLLRSFYLLSALLIVVIYGIPPLSSRFLAYGARDTQVLTRSPSSRREGLQSNLADADADNKAPERTSAKRRADTILDQIALLKVPHHYFTHFYILSLCSCLVWLHQILTRGPLFSAVANHTELESISETMTLSQIFLVWILYLVQSTRRVYECISLSPSPPPTSKPKSETQSKSTARSRMWIGHYLLGLAFYLATNMAIWVEGVPDVVQREISHPHPKSELHVFPLPRLSWLSLSMPLVFRTIFPLTLFAWASLNQHQIHVCLARLPKYTLPSGRATGSTITATRINVGASSARTSTSPTTHWTFRYFICPHYTMEGVIYLSLALLAAPQTPLDRSWIQINQTMSCALVLVLVNLGVTAQGTKAWYLETFRGTKALEDEIEARWRMVPYVW